MHVERGEDAHVYALQPTRIQLSGKAETMIQMVSNMIGYTSMLTYGKRRTTETTKTAKIELEKTVCAWLIVHNDRRRLQQ
jgi:hypothetical protein